MPAPSNYSAAWIDWTDWPNTPMKQPNNGSYAATIPNPKFRQQVALAMWVRVRPARSHPHNGFHHQWFPTFGSTSGAANGSAAA